MKHAYVIGSKGLANTIPGFSLEPENTAPIPYFVTGSSD